jgi:hypothetical protein
VNISSASAEPVTRLLAAPVLKTLLYYDLFRFPLTAEEIHRHCSVKGCTVALIEEELRHLVQDGKVFQSGRFYSVNASPEIFTRRLAGNRMAEAALKKAFRRSRLIARFPFVRSVCISGSLSKNYFDKTTDIDFFIITEPRRLWLCRTLLILYKKIFLLNSKKYFCVNYFIDSENLTIPDKNIFTATEVITLLPASNYEFYRKFYEANDWVNDYFPNSAPRLYNGTREAASPFPRRAAEKILGGQLGEWLDVFFYRKTWRHWKKKFGYLNRKEFEVNMRSRRSVSKHHPQGFQFQVLRSYEARLKEFEQQHRFSFHHDQPDTPWPKS